MSKKVFSTVLDRIRFYKAEEVSVRKEQLGNMWYPFPLSLGKNFTLSTTNWSSGVSTLLGNTQKPTGIADMYSKFRPVKRVSPLKHQPESSENNESDDQKNQKVDCKKGDDSPSMTQNDDQTPDNGDSLKTKCVEAGVLLGELEHYDLDMDEILDVPYIKSNQQLAAFTKAAPEKKILNVYSTLNGLSSKSGPVGDTEKAPTGTTQFCVLSPVKGSQLKKAQSIIADQHKQLVEEHEFPQPLVKSGSVHEPEAHSKGFLNRTSADKMETSVSHCQLRTFHLQSTESKHDKLSSSVNWNSSGNSEEKNEDVKKTKSILNIVKEGQISLLPHLAADNLDKIHDESGNNLLHVAASRGHAECLQHLTSLMGEDCLNERNNEQLTPAGLAIKNGQLECVRWMVSETEAIAELSCSKDHQSLIHYAGCYGQEKILLWLLQFMQEQGISLDEIDQDGNSAVHVAAQHGYLGCIQTLVEYGANVTMQNHVGEKPSQSAERQGYTMCSRYLVVVETCMSLASQVVKLTKQLKEQTVERVGLQNQLQELLETQRADGKSQSTSSSSPSSPISRKPQWKQSDTDDVTPPKNKLNTHDGIQIHGSAGTHHLNRPKMKEEESDKILRQLLGKEISENVCMQEKLSLEFQDVQASKNTKKVPLEKKELKLARLKHLMQRSLSESDTDSNNSEDQKNTPVKRIDKPRPRPIVENTESTENLHLMIKKHALASGRRFPFGIKTSKSVDGHSPSPTSESSDPDNESHYQTGTVSQSQVGGDPSQANPDTTIAPKIATSPKSALKSPSSKRRTAQNSKLRVTFEEPVVQLEQTEIGFNGEKDKEQNKSLPRPIPNADTGDQQKRPFGTFRSIMETLSGNQNNNNNYHSSSLIKTSSPFTSLGRKATDSKGNSATSTKGKNKPALCSSYTSFSTRMLTEDHLDNNAWHNSYNEKPQSFHSKNCFEEPELQELFL
ncbi:synphilin-1 isoform X1 [Pantherophis guttatus]|uniref:Synphilin-1 isoform X1 n=2 Tax=Pantherophis guttatus TaxID=94885 RepID=A0A6P9CZK9_PANGU|nr:synphilin-1 isoform X1 [Pantherophis guttatus]